MLKLPEKYINASELEYFKKLQKRLPDFYYDVVEDDKIINPAKSWTEYKNVECPQFYPLFPFNLFEKHQDDEQIEIFKNTWKHGKLPKKYIWSWHQDGIFYARMGMTEKVKWYNTEKLKSSNQRFPTFWGPGHDWGGSGMIGLQEMLMQTSKDKILLFPTWPKEWDVSFKLHAPQNTVIEGELVNREVQKLKVTPKIREKDLVICDFKTGL